MTNKLHILLLFGSLFSAVVAVRAQDPVFSQFYAAPLQINPAFAGATYAPRVTLNYRNQYPGWPNAYATYSASYEQSIEALNSGLGFVVMADVAGDGIYKTNRFHAVYGYQVRVVDDFHVKFGVEAGMIQTTVDWNKLQFGDQLDPITGGVDPSGAPNVSEEQRPVNLNKTIFDVSAGLLAYGGNFYGGVSVKHLNSPDESLLEINENLAAGLPLRLTVHTGVEINIDGGNNRRSSAFISPNLMFIKQGEFTQVNAGAYAGFGKFFGGLWYRHTFSNPDAAIALVGFREGVLRIGYSYDLTVSELATAPGGAGGAHEISLTINFDDSRALQRSRRSSRYNDCFKMFN
jgi:type IX secretion system PorP/SprF family membrane protein